MKMHDLTGRKFSRLTPMRPVAGFKPTTWLCRCDCGAEVTVRAGNLKSGNTKSCGCLTPDIAKGWAGTPEITAFWNAKNRCERESSKCFPHYGGSGIQFRFRDMDEFIAALGPRPTSLHSLDRIDPDGHYETGNVRWALPETQATNKRTSLWITINGESKPLRRWCEQYGQPYKRVWERINEGWDPYRALTEPAAKCAKVWGDRDETILTIEALA